MADIITVERRRRWSEADKSRIVAETFEANASVSEVARRHSLHTSQLFGWRRLAREGGLGAGRRTAELSFAPVIVSDAPDSNEVCPPLPAVGPQEPIRCGGSASGRMEIVAGRGRRVVVFSDVDPEALSRVLRVLERR